MGWCQRNPEAKGRSTKEPKGTQGKPREMKGSQRKPKETKPRESNGNKGKRRETQGNQKKPSQAQGNQSDRQGKAMLSPSRSFGPCRLEALLHGHQLGHEALALEGAHQHPGPLPGLDQIPRSRGGWGGGGGGRVGGEVGRGVGRLGG